MSPLLNGKKGRAAPLFGVLSGLFLCRSALPYCGCAELFFLVAVAEMRVGLGLAAMLAMLGNVDLLQIALAAALVMRAAAHIAGNTDIFHIVASFRLRVVCAAARKIYTCLAQSFVV